MPTSNEHQVLERLRGTGTITDGDTEVIRCSYQIQVERVSGLKNVGGSIQTKSIAVDLVGKTLQLNLSDGRKLQFFVTRADPMTGKYSIRGTGELR